MSVTDAVRRELDQILSEPLSSVVERERNTLDQLLDSCGRRVVLFGAGNLGRRALASLRSIGVEPLAFADNNSKLWDTAVDRVTVLSPEVAAERFGSKALFLVTIWQPNHWYSETEHRLKTLGCPSVAPPSPLYWRFSATFLPFYAQDTPTRLLDNRDDIVRAGSIWADESSSLQYLRQVRWRGCGQWNFSRADCEVSYFPDRVFQLVPGEVFVDCGAFDGDTIRAILQRQPEFGRIFAVEPDRKNFVKLEAYVGSLAPSIRDRITLHRCVVGAERGFVNFSDTGGLGSRASATGELSVPSLPISELVDGQARVTYIKMDIEGAEPEALEGARFIIERDRPVLAVCVYHQPDHLWQLPLMMTALFPEYQMYLQCHEGDGWQTVAYAVPPQRVAKR
jgi:FkbM family methyltransferase